MKRLKVADLFCGAGGFSEGFRQRGFEIAFGLDNWKPAVDTHRLNHPQCNTLLMDILELDTPEKIDAAIPDVKVIIGGPPCVAFSGSNKAGKADKSSGIRLIEAFLRIIAWKKKKGTLKYWILENVPNSEKYIKEEYSWKELGLPGDGPSLKMGRRIVFNAADFGAPQTRKRLFCGDYPFPKKTHEGEWIDISQIMESLTSPLSKKRVDKIKDILYGFSISSSKLTDHFYDSKVADFEWRQAKRQKEDHGYMGRMSFPEDEDRPSRTIMATRSASTREAMIFAAKKNGRKVGYRMPTIREIASLMSFPITYQFEGSSEPAKYRLIGNAVCPRMAAALADAILGKEGLKKQKSFIPLPKYNLPALNLNGTRRSKKSPRPRRPDSKFEMHISHIKLGGMRAQLSNTDSDSARNKIIWNCKIRYGPAKNHKYAVVDNEKLELLLGDYERFKALKRDMITTFDVKFPSAEEFQNRYCNYVDMGISPEGVLKKIKSLVDKHYPEKKFKGDSLNNSSRIVPIDKDDIPLRVAIAAFCCNFVVSKLS